MKRKLPERMFQNKWKSFSHMQRKLHRPATIEQFKEYNKNHGFIAFREPQDYSIEKLPQLTEKPRPQHWELFLGLKKLEMSDQELLNSEMRLFCSENSVEIQYNKMIQIRHEMARLAEMLRVEDFRYEFIRANLHERNVKQLVIDLPKYERRNLISGLIKKEKAVFEKRIVARSRGDELLDRVSKLLGSRVINVEEKK